MANLSTTYLGLSLKNPIVISSSGLTNSIDKLKKMEENGAGAVVLKSIFEEQIKFEVGSLSDSSDYPEAHDYLNSYVKSNTIDSYLDLIEQAKKELSIPVIASVNCVSASEWIDFTVKLEKAGADAIEINVFYVPTEIDASASKYEKTYFDIAEKLKAKVKVPLVFKLGQYFTNPLYMANQLRFRKVDAVVLFNRFYAPDIDTKSLKINAADVFSKPDDIRQTLRWVGMMSDRIKNLEISASTGVHDGMAAIKMLLAGAQTVQMCSAVYKNGPAFIQTVLKEMTEWMDSNNYDTIDAFRGKLSYAKIKDPEIYERVQFMKYFSNMQ